MAEKLIAITQSRSLCAMPSQRQGKGYTLYPFTLAYSCLDEG